MFYTIKDISEVVYTMGHHEGTPQIEYDVGSMKLKIILTRFWSTFGTLRFDNKSFFITLLGFTPYSDYKPNNATHADSSCEYTSGKILNLSLININLLKCDVIDCTLQNGLKQPIIFSFVSDKPPWYKVNCELETIH